MDEVEEIEIGREVVFCVSSCHMVQVGFMDKLIPISVCVCVCVCVCERERERAKVKSERGRERRGGKSE